MRSTLPLILLTLVLSSVGHAQDIRYVSDKQFVPLRSGAGGNYRILHRGLPSGTRLTVLRESEDGAWVEVTTDTGATGWLGAQYIMEEEPARDRLAALIAKSEEEGGLTVALQADIDEMYPRDEDGDDYDNLLPPSTSTSPLPVISETSNNKDGRPCRRARAASPMSKSALMETGYRYRPTSFLTRTKRFRKMCDQAFDFVDTDGTTELVIKPHRDLSRR